VANYIDKNILCQAYIHVEPENLSAELLETFQKALYDFAPKRAQFYLYPGVEVIVEIEDGSLKTRITVMGTLALLWTGVAQYPDFRAGVIQIFNDSERLSNFLVSEGLFEAKTKHGAILRTEARTGVVGQLRCIVTELDAIRKANGHRSEVWMEAKLKHVSQDVDALLDNLKSGDDRELVRKGLVELCNQLPKSPSPRPNKRPDEYAIAAYREHRSALRSKLDNPTQKP
jgi:hypothetical protein